MTQFIGDQIRNARKQAGYSQRRVAERAQVTQSQVSSLENGGDVQMHTLLRVAQVLNLQFMLVPFDAVPLVSPQGIRQNEMTDAEENYHRPAPLYRLSEGADEW
ncbi:helix-turn-helix domain-containing protein [Acidithiobacillus sp.]|uniref:helix-turn-helix domain-containing protein n=1 Tax=Acidithiobacillus sp. TaxID=1872118 RepID=UPI003CFC2A71